jgi:hypothetical protein
MPSENWWLGSAPLTSDRFNPDVKTVAIWILLLIAVALGGIVWIQRFSLRTLLIATTLIAVVLGLVVWMTRGGAP